MPSAVLYASAGGADIPLWLVVPFAALLLMIAVMPLTPHRVKHLWEHYYPHLSIALGLAVALHYVFRIPEGTHTVLHTLEEYVSFICLIGALFVVAGGIHIRIRGQARPLGNVVFLFIGAVLANLIGTTGASMVLIRPFIALNKYRVTGFHIVFFIFVVSNIGGALTPIGDPPLFLGYLHGIPFFWLLEHAMLPWATTLAGVLGIFYVLDRRNFVKAPEAVARKETAAEPLVRVTGLHNVLFLGLVMVGVFLPSHYFIRELVMVGAAAASYLATKKEVRSMNEFTFHPIKEVGFLFIGIFMTMMPALGYLERHGKELGFEKPIQYYFATGGLSAVLDNAPTYLNFLTLAEASEPTAEVLREAALERDPVVREKRLLDWMREERNSSIHGRPAYLYIVAVSLGAVFFGAMTYIGNGPNFMVKSIAESSKVRVPSFFGYLLRYAVPFLLPVLVAVGFLFL